MINHLVVSASLLLLLNSCSDASSQPADTLLFQKAIENKTRLGAKTIHVFVALCDNRYQGIVPVSEKLGSGQDPKNNLYWGAAYGLKTFFGKSNEWSLIESIKKPETNILERILFKHKTQNIYMLADAYDGEYIKQTTLDFLRACSGKGITSIKVKENEVSFGGLSDVIAYIGHNGLMDFYLSDEFIKQNEQSRNAIILACKSKQYFSSYIKQTGALPLLWTTGLMAPESYILHDALDWWIKTGKAVDIRKAAAAAYSRYQKCSIKAAQNLLVTGW